MAISRGLRNNNPLNIRKSSTQFVGETDGNDASFKTFKTMAYGYRAAFVILRTYYKKYGCNTVGKIIKRWAPPTENNTTNYIATVSRRSKIPSGRKLSFSMGEMTAIVAAMSYVENGEVADAKAVAQGWDLMNKE